MNAFHVDAKWNMLVQIDSSLFLASIVQRYRAVFYIESVIILPVLNLIYDILTREDSNLSFPALYHTSGEILIKNTLRQP